MDEGAEVGTSTKPRSEVKMDDIVSKSSLQELDRLFQSLVLDRACAHRRSRIHGTKLIENPHDLRNRRHCHPQRHSFATCYRAAITIRVACLYMDIKGPAFVPHRVWGNHVD